MRENAGNAGFEICNWNAPEESTFFHVSLPYPGEAFADYVVLQSTKNWTPVIGNYWSPVIWISDVFLWPLLRPIVTWFNYYFCCYLLTSSFHLLVT